MSYDDGSRADSDEIRFEDIYSDHKQDAYDLFLLHANDFLDGFGADSIEVNPATLTAFIASLKKKSFPACGGYESSSPFKKAAYFYVRLHENNPFSESINSKGTSVEGVSEFEHSIASMVGFSFVQRCLLGATVLKEGGSAEVLEQSISVSDHYLKDLIEASRDITMGGHFRTYSVLFEALSYAANVTVSYQEKRVEVDAECRKSDMMYPGLGVIF